MLVALVGVGLLLYPSAGNWFATRAQAASTNSYVAAVERIPQADREAVLRRAREYNARIGVQTLTDPYTDVDEVEATSAEYDDQLRVEGAEAMARVRIPAIDVRLPVFHGTSEETLTAGVGHLQGSSLPVGGPDTNAVLTGHSGLPNAILFTDLHQVVTGDLVYIDVLGETLAYRVDLIETVLPTETDLLRVVAGEDLLTLVTCTPVGVNSHRLVIRAERVELPEGDEAAAETSTEAQAVPFAWWLLGAAGAVLTGAVVLVVPPRARSGGGG
uniref:class C sortase n=1 Tax=Cellulomonas hominis TaxID=156981 RepID=UPI0018AAA0A7|nr:class C sortase [Cellulomonas hominis]